MITARIPSFSLLPSCSSTCSGVFGSGSTDSHHHHYDFHRRSVMTAPPRDSHSVHCRWRSHLSALESSGPDIHDTAPSPFGVHIIYVSLLYECTNDDQHFHGCLHWICRSFIHHREIYERNLHSVHCYRSSHIMIDAVLDWTLTVSSSSCTIITISVPSECNKTTSQHVNR